MAQQTAIEWLMNELANTGLLVTKDIDNLVAYNKAKQMAENKEYEIKAFWFGRGILAGRENKINELKPIKNK